MNESKTRNNEIGKAVNIVTNIDGYNAPSPTRLSHEIRGVFDVGLRGKYADIVNE